jgi:hypothetical protein
MKKWLFNAGFVILKEEIQDGVHLKAYGEKPKKSTFSLFSQTDIN